MQYYTLRNVSSRVAVADTAPVTFNNPRAEHENRFRIAATVNLYLTVKTIGDVATEATTDSFYLAIGNEVVIAVGVGQTLSFLSAAGNGFASVTLVN